MHSAWSRFYRCNKPNPCGAQMPPLSMCRSAGGTATPTARHHSRKQAPIEIAISRSAICIPLSTEEPLLEVVSTRGMHKPLRLPRHRNPAIERKQHENSTHESVSTPLERGPHRGECRKPLAAYSPRPSWPPCTSARRSPT